MDQAEYEMDQAEYESYVAGRAAEVLAGVVEQEQGKIGSIWTVHAQLALGQATVDQVHQSVVRDLAQDGAAAGQGRGPFQLLPAALLLRRWSAQLAPETIDQIQQLFCGGPTDRGNTENHWLMYYTGLLLAAEYWADQGVLFNGRPPGVIRAEATRWILGTIQRTACLGHHEYDSTGYHITHLAPYLGLWEHAGDAHLHRQVEQVLAVLVADMALEYFHGAWAGGHSREGYRQNTWSRVGSVQTLQYLYFGGQTFDPVDHIHAHAIPAAVSPYRPPALFAAIALDRSRPHAVRKTRAPRNIIRHAEHDAEPVRKYTWMSRSFALGSTQLGLPGAPAGPIDLVSWDLTWKGPRHNAKIVCNHPYVHPGRFSAFLGTLPQSARRQIGDDKPYLQRQDRLFGASPYEGMMQHQGTIIVLYRIPADDESPFVNLFLPRNIDWIARKGWLLAAPGGFYLALRPIGSYAWERIRESSSDSLLVRDGDLIDGWLLRLGNPDAGLVLEAVEEDRISDFAAYCQRRTDSDVDLSGWPGEERVAVSSIDGVRLEMTFDGPHKVDGTAIDYDAWPLYDAPGAQAEVNTGKVLFRYGNRQVALDFGVDPDTPMIPMRVIG